MLGEGHRVIVFTQYLDTLYFIRDRLVARHGDRIACYSGRGGELWDPHSNDWRLVKKSEVKARSKRNHPQAITILLGTDAASESIAFPLTQEKLAAWCLAHPAPGMRIDSVPEPDMNTIDNDGTSGCLAISWAYAPAHLGVDPSDEILATFSGALADRHPPTAPVEGPSGVEIEGKEGVRLLTWGDPYLLAWLEAIRGENLKDADYQSLGMKSTDNPLA